MAAHLFSKLDPAYPSQIQYIFLMFLQAFFAIILQKNPWKVLVFRYNFGGRARLFFQWMGALLNYEEIRT